MHRMLLTLMLVWSVLGFLEEAEPYKVSKNVRHLRRVQRSETSDNGTNEANVTNTVCPDLNLNTITHPRCQNSDGEGISCSEATNNSTLTYRCPLGYKIADGVKDTTRCINGIWESPFPECQIVEDPTDTVRTIKEDKIVCIFDSRTYPDVKPEDFNASLCTHVVYYYAGLSFKGNLVDLRNSLESYNKTSLYENVAYMKRENENLKVLLSISGLGIENNDEFPTVAKDAIKRSILVDSVKRFLRKYNFDGIDIFWRYPYDKEHYKILIGDLGNALRPLGKLLTATVYASPAYLGYHIPTMVLNLNWINVECYGHYDEFSKYTGQNSALYPSSIENSFERDTLNVKACGNNWNSYGIKKDKIVIGITMYGRQYTLKNPHQHQLHSPVTGQTGINHTSLVSYSQQCQKFQNWTRIWDDEQKNPYKYYEDKWLGYDDSVSISMKAAYIKKQKFGGVAVFSIDADDVQGTCGPKQVLLKQINTGIGKSVETDNEDIKIS